MNKNFYDMYTNVGSNIQDTSTAMQTIIKRYVNECYFDVLRRINWECVNRDYSFTASGQDNVLPSDFGKELAVYDSTNKIALTRTSQENEVDGYLSSISSTGSLARYAILDLPVRTQSFTAGTLSCVSSSASDTSQVIFIRGIVNGVEVTENVTLTGTTPAVSTNSFSRIISISKSATTTGSVTITRDTTTLAVFAPLQKAHYVKVMRLYSAPSSATTIVCPYIIKPMPLSNDYDTLVMDIADIIELGATAKSWQYKRQGAKAADYFNLYERGISQLIWERANQPNDGNVFTFGVYDRETV